jgi:hypothetical protein
MRPVFDPAHGITEEIRNAVVLSSPHGIAHATEITR